MQIELSLERKAMMCRQLVGAVQRPITATRSHVEEGLELRPDSLEGLQYLRITLIISIIIITFLSITVPASLNVTIHPFQASKHGEQALVLFVAEPTDITTENHRYCHRY